MKIVLEGEQAEVMALIQAMAGRGAPSIAPVENEIISMAVQAQAPVEEMPSLFGSVVHGWLEGFSIDGTDHWDDAESKTNPQKGESLRDLGNSRQAGPTLRWIQSQGGLTQAVQYVLDGDTQVSRGVAVNMAQVASILFPDLAQTLEHFDPFED